MTVIEIADFTAVRELNAVPQPIKAIRQNHFARSTSGGSVDIDTGDNCVAIAQVDLALVWVGESVGLPKRHVSIIAGRKGQEANP